MKKILALILALIMILGALSACDSASDKSGADNADSSDTALGNGETDNADASQSGENDEGEENKEDGNAENQGKVNVLDGKKVIFIGNSHTYYGMTVLEKTQSVLTQEARSNDKGYFYQICKSNGADVAVTNWTFGNHSFDDLFNHCDADRGCNGVDHLSYLTDRNYDYVVMQQGTSNDSVDTFISDCSMVMDVFKEANPDVKFVFLVSRRAQEKNLKWLAGLKILDEMGVIIVDWGKLVDDVITGKTQVPGAVESYEQNSFIIRKSESDGYHPNMLTGYITSLMTYCAITGETAEGQDYSFCGNNKLNAKFSFNTFISTYYTYKGATTNFKKIFNSESDMNGIQKLVDKYLEEKAYLKY